MATALTHTYTRVVESKAHCVRSLQPRGAAAKEMPAKSSGGEVGSCVRDSLWTMPHLASFCGLNEQGIAHFWQYLDDKSKQALLKIKKVRLRL